MPNEYDQSYIDDAKAAGYELDYLDIGDLDVVQFLFNDYGLDKNINKTSKDPYQLTVSNDPIEEEG